MQRRNETCNFQYMKPSDNGAKRIEEIRLVFTTAEKALRGKLSESRETSIVWTKLEEACMFATKGICLDEYVPKDNVPPLAGVVNG